MVQRVIRTVALRTVISTWAALVPSYLVYKFVTLSTIFLDSSRLPFIKQTLYTFCERIKPSVQVFYTP